MADTTRADVMSYLEKANMVEISELISEIEDKFGVTVVVDLDGITLEHLGMETSEGGMELSQQDATALWHHIKGAVAVVK